MRIGKTREQQRRLRQPRRQRAAELVRIGLTHKQIAERLGVAALDCGGVAGRRFGRVSRQRYTDGGIGLIDSRLATVPLR